jgi:hypothetical protein
MITKQISVFLENKTGRLNEVSQILAKNNINISAFTIADTSDFGILRMIVSNPEKAIEVLKNNQFSVKSTPVVLVKTTNSPGDLSSLLAVLNSENISIEYMYAFSVNDNQAIIAIRTSDSQKCIDVLLQHQHELHSIKEW